MQPPPDAVGEFKVVTNNRAPSTAAPPARRSTSTTAAAPTQFHGDGVGVLPRHRAERDRLLQAGRPAKPPLDRNQFGGVARRPDRQEQGVLLRRLRRASGRRARSTAFSTHRRRRRSARASCRVDIRDPRTGVVYPAGTPIPMTAFARKVLGGLPRHERCRRREQLLDRCRSSPTTPTRPAARSTCRSARRCRCSAATAGATSTPTISRRSRCRPAAPATATSTRATSSSCSARPRSPSGRSLLEVRFGWSRTQAGKNPPALGTDSALDQFGLAGSADRRAHRRRPADAADHRLFGSRPPGDQPAVAVPDRLQPEGQLHVADGRALVQEPATSSSASTPKCRTSTRSTAATPTPASSRARPARPRSNLYNLADFMLGLRSQYALSSVPRRQPAPQHALHLRAGRLARQRAG